jgi:hypothetical protein
MRTSLGLSFVSVLAVACSHHGTAAPDAPAPPAFEVISKDVTLQPGEQITYCYYAHTSNTTTTLVNKWVSDMTPGSHHAIMFTGGTTQQPDGTLDPSGNCGFGQGNGLNQPVWTFATQTPHQELDLPSDDGTGKPLAQQIQPNTPIQFQLHYLNSTDQPLQAHIDLKAYALPDNTPFTQTDAYVTYNNDISVGPGATDVNVTASCPLPQNVTFWSMSTHSHKQSIATVVSDGSTGIFTSTDWEHPGAQYWNTSPFYAFTAPQLTWTCTYNNNAPPPYCNQGGPAGSCSNGNATVVSGPSAVTNEMCMAAGYYFPSQGPKFAVQANGSCFAVN